VAEPELVCEAVELEVDEVEIEPLALDDDVAVEVAVRELVAEPESEVLAELVVVAVEDSSC
jgi:hypothetical protein